jgi:hypothetical protein
MRTDRNLFVPNDILRLAPITLGSPSASAESNTDRFPRKTNKAQVGKESENQG